MSHSNDMMQDCLAVMSILDAIMAKIHIELPTVANIHLLSDNVRCYHNAVLPVMAPFIAKKHGRSYEEFFIQTLNAAKTWWMLTSPLL